jgi:hypothetical protein
MRVLSSLKLSLRFKYLIICIAIGVIKVKAQIVYQYKIVDRSCDCPEFRFDGKPGFNLRTIDSSENDIEIRLSISPDHHGTRKNIVLKKSNNLSTGNYYFRLGQSFISNWPDSAKSLKYWERDPFWKFNLPTTGLDSVVEKVINHNLSSLKSQNEFYKGKEYFTPYLVTYKIGSKVGSFSFGNPDDFLEENPNIQAFKDYKAILNSILPLIASYSFTTSKYPREE